MKLRNGWNLYTLEEIRNWPDESEETMRKKDGADARSKVGPLNKTKSKKQGKNKTINRSEATKGNTEKSRYQEDTI